MRRPDHDSLDASRMPFGDHLEELRMRLWRALAGFGACVLLVFVVDLIGFATDTTVGIARPAFDVLTEPVEYALRQFHARRVAQLRRRLEAGDGLLLLVNTDRAVPLQIEHGALLRATGREPPAPGADEPERYVTLPARIAPAAWALVLDDALRLLYRPPNLRVLGPAEGMVVYVKVALLCGALLGAPWVFGQLWAFVAAGLYADEKRLVNLYLPISVALFFAGVVLCQLWVMPATVEALFGFNAWLDLEPDLRLNEWLNFALLMPVVFGLAFQTPLVMWCLERLGVVEIADYRRHRKAACFLLAVGAAVLTPGIDIYSMLFLWLPLVLLYEAGIWLCQFTATSRLRLSAKPQAAETVGPLA